jgi:hypothetical protein
MPADLPFTIDFRDDHQLLAWHHGPRYWIAVYDNGQVWKQPAHGPAFSYEPTAGVHSYIANNPNLELPQ